MKNIASKNPLALVLIPIAFLLTHCNIIDKADDVAFNTTLDQSVSANETETADNKAYSQSIILDATTDSEISRYKEKIKSFEVTKVTYKILNYTGGDVTLSNSKISFGDSAGSTPTVLATISTLNLHDAYSTAAEYELTLASADVSKLNAFLKSDKALKIYVEGTLSSTPVSFDVKVKLDVKITANAL